MSTSRKRFIQMPVWAWAVVVISFVLALATAGLLIWLKLDPDSFLRILGRPAAARQAGAQPSRLSGDRNTQNGTPVGEMKTMEVKTGGDAQSATETEYDTGSGDAMEPDAVTDSGSGDEPEQGQQPPPSAKRVRWCPTLEQRVAEVPELQVASLEQLPRADRVVIYKAERRLELWSSGKVLFYAQVALGFSPEGHKSKEGDGKTPEGNYRISGRNPKSAYYLSLRVSYPSAEDTARAKARGEQPGGDIMIHGLPNGRPEWGDAHLDSDWTLGCVAVTNAEMDYIWQMVGTETPVDIHP